MNDGQVEHDGIREAPESTDEVLRSESTSVGDHAFKDIVGSSAVLRDALRQVEVVAPTDATVRAAGAVEFPRKPIATATLLQVLRKVFARGDVGS